MGKKKKIKILPSYRITIPKEIREHMGLRVGQEVEIEAKGGRL
ncbi:MAG: AbrB/MazE/SpoVT family DNA-binding domain-containing protein [Candidatus Njordarchaeia archaeon]